MSDLLAFRRQPYDSQIDGSELLFSIGEQQTINSGYLLMVQCWLILFLSEAGSSIADMEGGGDALAIVESSSLTEEPIRDIKLRLDAAAQKATQEMIRDQIENEIDDVDQLIQSGQVLELNKTGDDEAEIVVQLISQSRIANTFVMPVIGTP